MAMDKAPAEATGFDLKLGRNRWLGMITLRTKFLRSVTLFNVG